MPANRWNTLRYAAYGGIAGLLWAAVQSVPLWGLGGDYQARAVGHLIGGFAGGAALVGFVVGLRNLWLRAR
jgi:hypothetical protein